MTAQTRSVLYTYFETEIWKPIPGFAPYEASSLGRIRNSLTMKLIKPVLAGPKRKQYYRVYVGGGRSATKQTLHRLVLLAFFGKPPKLDMLACHRDDNQFNNELSNLYWGTHKNNTQDQIKSGKFYVAKGEGNGQCRYSKSNVLKILSEYTGKRGEQSKLARKYKMSVSNVHLIVHGQARKHDCAN